MSWKAPPPVHSAAPHIGKLQQCDEMVISAAEMVTITRTELPAGEEGILE